MVKLHDTNLHGEIETMRCDQYFETNTLSLQRRVRRG